MIDPFDFIEYLKNGQWYVEIRGESFYDCQYWEVIIKDILHIHEWKHREERYDISLKQVLKDAIVKLAKRDKSYNGYAALYSYRKRMEKRR